MSKWEEYFKKSRKQWDSDLDLKPLIMHSKPVMVLSVSKTNLDVCDHQT